MKKKKRKKKFGKKESFDWSIRRKKEKIQNFLLQSLQQNRKGLNNQLSADPELNSSNSTAAFDHIEDPFQNPSRILQNFSDLARTKKEKKD